MLSVLPFNKIFFKLAGRTLLIKSELLNKNHKKLCMSVYGSKQTGKATNV
jgi:hypothetical protein